MLYDVARKDLSVSCAVLYRNVQIKAAYRINNYRCSLFVIRATKVRVATLRHGGTCCVKFSPLPPVIFSERGVEYITAASLCCQHRNKSSARHSPCSCCSLRTQTISEYSYTDYHRCSRNCLIYSSTSTRQSMSISHTQNL